MKWDDAKLKALERHWKTGLSITDISRAMSLAFGEKISRNAVIGKATRIGLTQKHKREACIGPRAVLPHEKPRQEKRQKPAPVKAVPVKSSEPKPAAARPDPTPLKLLEQTPRRRPGPVPGVAKVVPMTPAHQRPDRADEYLGQGCRWPIGDPLEEGFHYCDARPRVHAKPYCPAHCAAAYTNWNPAEAKLAEDAATCDAAGEAA